MVECEFCGEEFEGKEDLHIHWMDEHEEEINSHQKDNAKKAKKAREEREKVRKEQRKKYIYQGVGAAVLLLVAGVLGSQLIPSGSNSGDISLEGEPMIGEENASVTVVKFGDFQCPACNRFEQNTFQGEKGIKEQYVDTGKVKFYWKDYPLVQIHDWARPASEAMECVYREDKQTFWNVKAKLFNNQGTLNLGNVEDEIVKWAGEDGANSSEVRSCIKSGEASSEVRNDRQEGLSTGVTGTPTIYVNGEKTSSFDRATVKQAIESELKE